MKTSVPEPLALSEQVLAANEARQLTDKIRAGLEGIYQLIIDAYQHRVWMPLGYSSWDEYVRREFGSQSLRPPLEEREEVVQSLRDSGLSTRAIASATQTSKGTVERALNSAGAPNGAPDTPSQRILGQDGREYSPTKSSDSPSVNDADSAVSDDALDAVLDAPAEDVGVQVLDSEAMGQKRSEYAEKILTEFHGSDVAVLQKTMFLAEKVGSLVSPVSGVMKVDETAYADVAKDIAAAIRQFAYVAKTLAGARAEFENETLLDVVIDDLGCATDDLVSTVARMGEKKR